MLFNRDGSYKARGTSVHGGMMRSVWCLEKLGSTVSSSLRDQFKKTRRQKSVLEWGHWSLGEEDTEGRAEPGILGTQSVLFSSVP